MDTSDTDAIVSNERNAVVPGVFGLGVAGTRGPPYLNLMQSTSQSFASIV